LFTLLTNDRRVSVKQRPINTRSDDFNLRAKVCFSSLRIMGESTRNLSNKWGIWANSEMLAVYWAYRFRPKREYIAAEEPDQLGTTTHHGVRYAQL
jgi:hypothetical protein